jgi:hypothetical protein
MTLSSSTAESKHASVYAMNPPVSSCVVVWTLTALVTFGV